MTDDLGQLGLEKDTIPGLEKGLVPGLESGTVQLPELPDLGTGPPNETRPGVRNLRSWLNKNIKVKNYALISRIISLINAMMHENNKQIKSNSCIYNRIKVTSLPLFITKISALFLKHDLN